MRFYILFILFLMMFTKTVLLRICFLYSTYKPRYVEFDSSVKKLSTNHEATTFAIWIEKVNFTTPISYRECYH